MRRSTVRLTVLCGLTAWTLLLPDSPSARRQDTPPRVGQVFRGGTEVVLVDVYPHRDGSIVEGLTAADFEVLEDGRPQRIDAFEFVRLDAGLPAAPRRDPSSITEMRAVAADPHNRVFVVYLDNGHTTVEGGSRIRQPLVSMLERTVGPEDLFGVLTPGMRPQDLTLGRQTLSIDEQLGRFWAWGVRARLTPDNSDPMEYQLRECFRQRHIPLSEGRGFEEWLVNDGPVLRYLDEIVVDRRREDRTLTSLERLVDYLGALREARSVVVTVTDGWLLFGEDRALPNQPPRDQRFRDSLAQSGSRAAATQAGAVDVRFAECVQELNRLSAHDGGLRLRNLIQRANRSNVSFYPVASAGLAAFDEGATQQRIRPAPNSPAGESVGLRDLTRMSTRVSSLRTIAEATDGLAVVNSNDLAGGLRRVSDDVSAYYLLTYASTNSKPDGRYRKIEVRVKGPNLTVRARRGYVAARDVAGASRTTPAAAPVIPSGVTEALAVLTNVRSSGELFAHGVAAGDTVRIAVELAGPSASRWPAGTTATASIGGAGGTGATASAPLDAAWRHALITLPAPAGAGPWQVTVTVGTGPDRLQEQVAIAGPSDRVLGSPLVSRGRPGARSVLRSVGRFVFSRTERVHVEWPLLATVDRRTVRLLDSRGQPLAIPIAVTDITDPLRTVAANLVLSALANGDYVLEISAQAAGTTVERYVAFRVGQ